MKHLLQLLSLCIIITMMTSNLMGQTFEQDTAKANGLNKIAQQLRKKRSLDAIPKLQEAALLYQKHGLDSLYFTRKMNIAVFYGQLNILDKAEPLAKEIIEESNRLKKEQEHVEMIMSTTLGAIYAKKRLFDKSLEYYAKAEQIASKLGETKNRLTIESNRAIVFYLKGDLEKALKSLKKVELAREQSNSTAGLSTIYNNSAAFHNALGNKEEALAYLEKAVKLEESKVNKEWSELVLRYKNIAIILSSLGYPKRARAYLGRSNRVIREELNGDQKLYINNLDVEIQLMWEAKEYEILEQKILEQISLLPPVEFERRITAYLNLAGIYGSTKKYEKGLEALNETSEILAGATDVESYLIDLYKNTAGIHWNQLEYRNALLFYQKELSIYDSLYTNKIPLKAGVYGRMARVYEALDKRDSVLFCIREGLQEITIDGDIPKALKEHSYLDLVEFKIFLKGVRDIYVQFYLKTESEEDLDQAIQYARWTEEAISLLKEQATEVADQKNIIKYNQENNVYNVKLALLKYKQTDDEADLLPAFGAMEKNKSAILQSVLQDKYAQRISGVPGSLLNQKTTYQKRIAATQKAIIDAKLEGLEIDTLKNSLFDDKRSLEKLEKRLGEDYTAYKNLRTNHDVIDVAQIQQQTLDDKTALLEYLVADSSSYLLVITKNDFVLYELPFEKTVLEDQIQSFRTSITDYKFIVNQPQENYKKYTNTAHWLYQNLVYPAEKQLQRIESLIIIPDYTLGHIPFEVLLTEVPQEKKAYNTLPYLLDQYTVRYSYAAQLLSTALPTDDLPNQLHVLGFAASYDSIERGVLSQRTLVQQRMRTHLQPIPAVNQELDMLAEIINGGDYWKGVMATEAQFKQSANQYNVLHLAMHGILNQSHPMASAMAFTEDGDTLEDNFLYGYEIAQMDLSADLVVLSACETGYGRFDQGEGVMSMARSFMYAGVSSAVVSLWQVNDASTSVLMQLFYQNLNQGYTKAAALAMAKRSYMQRATGTAAHPAYWAAFVCIGDDVALVNPTNNWYWWLGGLLIMGIALGLVGYRRLLMKVQ